MLRKCLEEIAEKGYVMNFHYNPTLREISIAVTKAGETGKHAGVFVSAGYLSDDQKLVEEIRKLVDQLEGEHDE